MQATTLDEHLSAWEREERLTSSITPSSMAFSPSTSAPLSESASVTRCRLAPLIVDACEGTLLGPLELVDVSGPPAL